MQHNNGAGWWPVVIAIAGVVAGAFLGLLGVLVGDGVHCSDPSCEAWSTALLLAAGCCLLAGLSLVVAAAGIQPFAFMAVAGGAFTVALVLSIWVLRDLIASVVALLAMVTFAFAAKSRSDEAG